MMKDATAALAYLSDMDQRHSDANYFMRRATEERAAAEQARDPRARQSHHALAERYANAARAGDAANDELPIEAGAAAIPLLQPEFRILN